MNDARGAPLAGGRLPLRARDSHERMGFREVSREGRGAGPSRSHAGVGMSRVIRTPSMRPIGPSEAEGLSAFAHPIWREALGPMLPGGIDEAERMFADWQSPDAIRRDIAGGFVYGYVVDGGALAGYYAYRAEGEGLRISNCCLAPAYRGRGLCSFMLREMLARGREAGCRRAHLHVNVRNAPAIRACERNGFSVELHQIVYRGEGFSTNDYVMSREIRCSRRPCRRRSAGGGGTPST